MSQVGYIDQSGAKALKEWLKKDSKEYKKTLAACNCKFCQLFIVIFHNIFTFLIDDVSHMLSLFELSEDLFYPSTYDAIGVYDQENEEAAPDGQVFTVSIRVQILILVTLKYECRSCRSLLCLAVQRDKNSTGRFLFHEFVLITI